METFYCIFTILTFLFLPFLLLLFIKVNILLWFYTL